MRVPGVMPENRWIQDWLGSTRSKAPDSDKNVDCLSRGRKQINVRVEISVWTTA
jgi:hypothetical protein